MPRRTAKTGPDKALGVATNLRIKQGGDAILTSKNEMDNPLLEEFTPVGGLDGWTLDRPPEETGFAVYVKGPSDANFTRQAEHPFSTPHHDQKDPLIAGAPPPDATHQAPVAPYVLPPKLELVASAFVGFTQGWWAFTYAYEAAGKKATNASTVTVVFLNQGQGARVPMPSGVPDGIKAVILGMGGPFASQNDALNCTEFYRQKRVSTSPRLPATVDLTGPLLKDKKMSLTKNATFRGSGSTPPAGGPTRKVKKAKKKRPGRRPRRRR